MDGGSVRLIVGLGNPGARYAKTRHNIGFQVLDLLAARLKVKFDRIQHQAQTASATIDGQKVLLAKPQTFMNESGRAVGALVRFYKLPLDALLVVYDDLDLPVGALRLRPEGSAGGQGGMRSIIAQLGTQTFPRLRVGIGRPPGRMDAVPYVLQDFNADDELEMNFVRPEAVDAIEVWVREGLVPAMNRFNQRR